MNKIHEVFDRIWLKTKLSYPEATFIKKGDIEVISIGKGFVMKCKAKDLRK